MRWKQVEQEDAAGGQAVLFDEEEIVERHVGIGEYRGLEFLHVRARRIINEVPGGGAARLPFRWTINAYRGCSHACVYCLEPDTPVLMGDGTTRRIADVRAGDRVYGTQRVGAYRRYVVTDVLDRWETVKAAYRIVLEDGTEIIASGDHRFLTDRGWTFVAGTGCDDPHLTTNDELVGTGSFAAIEWPAQPNDEGRKVDPAVTGKRSIAGQAIKSSARLRVVAVERLGIDIPMVDLTTGTGDFIANGVVSHNCFARPTHDYLGLGIGEDFERKIVVKVNAVERLRAELAGRRWAGEPIAMGTNTDPYQRCEGKYHLTQGIIRVLAEHANPFSILTKSTLILRDLPLLVEAAKRTDVHVSFSIGTLDEQTWKLTEPGTPHPRRRVEAVRRFTDAGIRCGVLVAPVIPGMSDAPEQVEEVVAACVDAGAASISGIPLHLRPGVRDHYFSWLREARPDLVPEYERRYRGRSYLPKAEGEALAATIKRLAPRPAPRTPTPPPPERQLAPEQLTFDVVDAPNPPAATGPSR